MNIKDSLKIEIKNVKTNRQSIVHDDNDGSLDRLNLEKLIKEFVNCKNNNLYEYLKPHVKQFNLEFNLNTKIFFRGLDIESEKCLQSDFIGPSPCPGDNRYSKEGEQCLYLISNNTYIPKEIEIEDNNWLEQKYLFNLTECKIADLRASNNKVPNILSLAFFMAETGQTISGYKIEEELLKRDKSRYSYSQIIADVFKEFKWDGLCIPGVHGNEDDSYNNLVLFDSVVSNWKKWVSGKYYYHT